MHSTDHSVGINVSFLVTAVLSDAIMTPDDPDLTAEVKLGCMRRAGGLKLFHSGRLH